MLYNVEDILDFGQLESGKFRKTLSQFNIKEALLEIIDIQKYKAEAQKIDLRLNLKGFSNGSSERETCLNIVSDKQRI